MTTITDAERTMLVRRRAAEALRDARHDPDGFRPRHFAWTPSDPQRSAWRTFGLAANSAARISARALGHGDRANARLYAEAFLLLDSRKDRALGHPFQTVLKAV